MTRVVVVGAGLAGCTAALAAQRSDPDASVTLVTTAPERYRHEPGTIDVLGYTEASDGPVERPQFSTRSLPESHPYKLVGEDAVREGLALFDDLLVGDECLPYRSGGSTNALVATLNGRVRPTSRYPKAVAPGLVSRQEDMRLVGFEEITDFDAELAADRLSAATPYLVESTTVSFPRERPAYPPHLEFARALDRNAETPEGVLIRTALADEIRPNLDVEPRVGVPAVLGLTDHETVRSELESLLQADLFEIPLGAPNVPGLRLRSRLFELVEAAGIDRIEGSVDGIEEKGDSVSSIRLDPADGKETLDGDAFVLATGDGATGGIVATTDGVVEPIFGCPVSSPDRHLDWSEPDVLGDHAFARFGVDVSGALRPLSGDSPVYDNLFAAGTILAGHNFVAERSRGGVAIATGYAAGRRAVEG